MPKIDLLELRIHGIANSPPKEMLSSMSDPVRKDGDDQGSFWQLSPKSGGGPAVLTGGVHIVEVYSWGNQARTGGSALALIGRAIVHVAWLFVLPFGLCNLAYWARRNIKGADEEDRWWAGGDGAVAIRLFALLQTLFYMVGFMAVFVHLVGLQCFMGTAGGAPTTTCAAIPNWLDFLALWSPTSRAALLSVIPIIIIVLIYIISLRPRRLFNPERSFDDEALSRGERSSSAARRRTGSHAASDPNSLTSPDVAPPKPPLLGTKGFWQRSRVAHTTERTHVAAAIALVLFLLSYDAMMDAHPEISPLELFTRVDYLRETPVQATTAAVATLLLLTAAIVTGAAGMPGKVISIRSKRGWSTLLLIVTSITYLCWAGWALLAVRQPEVAGAFSGDADLRGLVVAATFIAALGAGIAVASLSWGLGWRRMVVYPLVAIAFVSVGIAELREDSTKDESLLSAPSLSNATIVSILLAVVISYLPSKVRDVRMAKQHSAWHGNGAAVALLLALFASLMITSLLVLGAHAWLTAETDTPPAEDGRRAVDPPVDPSVAPPEFYAHFAGMLSLLLIAMLLSVAAAAVAAFWRFPQFSIPALAYPPGTPKAEVERYAYLSGARALPKFYPRNEVKPSGRNRAVVDARRVAGLLHRGEPLLRNLAILTALALLPLAVPYLGDRLGQLSFWTPLFEASRWVLGLLALVIVGLVVTNAVTSAERPVGLIWDIVCFFPSAGHPFGPPCYGERAVPEVTKRIRRHSREFGDDARVILSAHSMGATIAVASVFALHGEEEDGALVSHVALLTHGVQLRAYFSRYFPEVFGPRVLGIKGSRAPDLMRRDPWERQVKNDYKTSVPPATPLGERAPDTLVSLLGGIPGDPRTPPRWRNLWRRTDPLGFPVTGYWNRQRKGIQQNPIDRGATERSPGSYLWQIARHEDYFSTLQYAAARTELVDMFLCNP